jgi:hypothetical protein
MCRFITPSELQHLSEQQLCALFNEVSRELNSSEPGTDKRRAALASLDNIQRAMAQRLAAPRPKPPGF